MHLHYMEFFLKILFIWISQKVLHLSSLKEKGNSFLVILHSSRLPHNVPSHYCVTDSATDSTQRIDIFCILYTCACSIVSNSCVFRILCITCILCSLKTLAFPVTQHNHIQDFHFHTWYAVMTYIHLVL